MILRKSREFTVNMGNYESVKIGASVELDTDKMSFGERAGREKNETDWDYLVSYADKLLTEAIENDIKEASELTSTRDSFILSWGKK